MGMDRPGVPASWIISMHDVMLKEYTRTFSGRIQIYTLLPREFACYFTFLFRPALLMGY